MSDPLRVALVAEGPTDGIVIEAALRSILRERSFVLKQIFPEGSAAFDQLGTGWVGVYRWCHQSAKRGMGHLRNDALIFQNYDLLLLHVDADVAASNYQEGSISITSTDGLLPCELACPPASDTTNEVRSVLLSWCGEATVPEKIVLCTPSKNTEAWVMAALFPDDSSVTQGIECHPTPQQRLNLQPKRRRIRKSKRDYQENAAKLVAAWPTLSSPQSLSEAYRFELEFLAAVSAE